MPFLRSGTNLKAQGYQGFAEELELSAWALSLEQKLDYVKVLVYSSHKRELMRITEFQPSPDVKILFPQQSAASQSRFSLLLSAKTIQEMRYQEDFGLEFVAGIKGQEQVFRTLVFVRDPAKAQAVFVLGSPRSGTSILGNSLSQVLTGSVRFGESHVLALVHDLGQKVHGYYASTPASYTKSNMLNELNPYLLTAQMQNVFKQQYETILGSKVFVDKTPGIPMLKALPTIMQLWPDAKIVFAKRRGLENVVSRLHKFPSESFAEHCQQWRDTMMLWQELKKQLPAYLEIDQYDIQETPARVAKQLKGFLGLNDLQEKAVLKSFLQDRPESTRKSTDLGSLDIATIDWNDEQKGLFHNICGQAMKIYAYSLTRGYYLASPQLQVS